MVNLSPIGDFTFSSLLMCLQRRDQYCTVITLMYCSILYLTLHLQLLKPWKLGTRTGTLDCWYQAPVFLTKRGHLHHSVLYRNRINLHTFLYPAFIPSLSVRRKKSHFIQPLAAVTPSRTQVAG